jgi:hypothetical protein
MTVRRSLLYPGRPPSPVNAWAAIGFSNSAEGLMVGTDAVVYPDKNGQIGVYYLTETNPNGLQPGSLNIHNKTNATTAGNNFWSFTRDLYAGHNLITNPSEVPMVAAVAADVLPTQHFARTVQAAIVNLDSGTVLPLRFIWKVSATHGLLMWLAWGIILPSGYIWARFLRGYPNDKSALWFEGHRTLMTIGFTLVMISAAIAIVWL